MKTKDYQIAAEKLSWMYCLLLAVNVCPSHKMLDAALKIDSEPRNCNYNSMFPAAQ